MRTQRLLALLRQRCPVCGQGRVFTGVLAMHKNCPHCGVIFEREHGYFLNSMFETMINYTLTVTVVRTTKTFRPIKF